MFMIDMFISEHVINVFVMDMFMMNMFIGKHVYEFTLPLATCSNKGHGNRSLSLRVPGTGTKTGEYPVSSYL